MDIVLVAPSAVPLAICRPALIEHGVSGLIVEPDPAAIGAAIDRLLSNRRDARVRGLFPGLGGLEQLDYAAVAEGRTII
jgi:glycosyltransferase involved in cell wall biosynthesis